MAAPKGGLMIDRAEAMPTDSPPEVEVVGSSFSPVTRRPPRAARADTDDGSAGDDGGAAEFAKFTDRELQDKIEYWSRQSTRAVLGAMPDGGEKMRISVNRMEKELVRRRVARLRKDERVRGQAVQAKPTGGSTNGSVDPYAFNETDELVDNVADKFSRKSCCTPSTKTYVQVKGAAFSEEPSHFSQGKRADLKKDGRTAKTLASHQLKMCARHQKGTDYRRLDIGNVNIDSRRNSLRSCNRNRPKNNTVDSKGSRNLRVEDATFGSDRRWEHSKNKASSHSKKDVVFLDDDDTEPAGSADVEISTKWDKSKIYYPSRNDPEAVELTHSDMKCLEPEEYLKSPVINVYMQYLKKSRPRGDLYMFNTYFYSKLEEALSTTGDRDSQFCKLRRWWRSVDIFEKAYLILPIHETMHWSLIIVCMPTKEAESGPIMLHLDSLQLHPSQKLFDIVASYLEAEWRHLQNDSYDFPFSRKIWSRLSRNIIKKKVEVPRQRNEYDCGLFMLYSIDRFIQEAPERMTRQDLDMFGTKWFHPKEASGLREGIRALLFDVFQSAQEDDEPSPPLSDSGDHSEGGDKDTDTVMAVTLE